MNQFSLHRTEWILLISILILLLFGFFSSLDVMRLRGEEGRRALVALEMVMNGNILSQHLMGWAYINKPPLFTWILASLFYLFDGAGPFLLRLPSLVALMIMGIVNFRVVRREIGQQEAILSTLFILTGGHILFYASVLSGEIDLLYGLVVFLQALVIYRGFQENRFLRMMVLSYLLMAIGILLKGIPSILFQGFTLLGMAALLRQWRPLFSWQHVLGVGLGFGLPAGYFLAYDQQGDAAIYIMNLLAEGSRKSVTESGVAENLVHVLTFPIQVFTDLLPWSLLLLVLLDREIRTGIIRHPFLRFALVFIVANIWIYWISPGARTRYLYMFIPFAMTILAWAVVRSRRLSFRVLLTVGLLLAVGRVGYNAWVLPMQVRDMDAKWALASFTEQLQEAAGDTPVRWTGPPDSLIMNRTFDLADPETIRLDMPTPMPYGISFDIARQGGPLMLYDLAPVPGPTYMVEAAHLDCRPVDTLAMLDGWRGPVLLCRFLTCEGPLPEHPVTNVQ